MSITRTPDRMARATLREGTNRPRDTVVTETQHDTDEDELVDPTRLATFQGMVTSRTSRTLLRRTTRKVGAVTKDTTPITKHLATFRGGLRVARALALRLRSAVEEERSEETATTKEPLPTDLRVMGTTTRSLGTREPRTTGARIGRLTPRLQARMAGRIRTRLQLLIPPVLKITEGLELTSGGVETRQTTRTSRKMRTRSLGLNALTTLTRVQGSIITSALERSGGTTMTLTIRRATRRGPGGGLVAERLGLPPAWSETGL